MGKSDDQNLPLHHRQPPNVSAGDGGSTGLSRIFQWFSFKCFFVTLLSVSVFLSAVFWALPRRHSGRSGYDAMDSIELRSSVQAAFKLDKTVSEIIPYIAKLEYSIYGEIGVPFTKVVVLHVHRSDALSNHTNVTFGVLSDPIDTPINSASLNLLRSSLLDVFLEQANLILPASIFGQSSSFQILKFPGGVTLNPETHSPFWQQQILFEFTLNNSIGEIKNNFADFKEQLRSGLHLRHSESVFVQVNNKKGSTVESPVTVEASIVSDTGRLPRERLRELAKLITGSRSTARNLGLDNSVFGKVKEISLSSLLNHSLQALPLPPAPSPSPSPMSPLHSHDRHRSESREMAPTLPPISHGSNGGHRVKRNPKSFAPSPSISSSLPSRQTGWSHAQLCFMSLLGSLIFLTRWSG